MYTRLVSAIARKYFMDEHAPGAPILLPPRYPSPPDGEHLFRVEIGGEGSGEAVTLPCYVPAETLVSYEAFVVLVLQATGVHFAFAGWDECPNEHRAKAAWRAHIGKALSPREDRLPASAPPSRGPVATPEEGGTQL